MTIRYSRKYECEWQKVAESHEILHIMPEYTYSTKEILMHCTHVQVNYSKYVYIIFELFSAWFN